MPHKRIPAFGHKWCPPSSGGYRAKRVLLSIVVAVIAALIAQLTSRYRVLTDPFVLNSYAIRNAPGINLVASHPRCVCSRLAESHLFVARSSPNDIALGSAAVEVSRFDVVAQWLSCPASNH